MTDKLPPIHPGEILREDFMLPLGLSSNALARAIGVTPARINEIVREITAETGPAARPLFRDLGGSLDEPATALRSGTREGSARRFT
jgi:addiction module HigA family antidote